MTKSEFAECLAFIAGSKLKKLEAWQMKTWYELASQHTEIPLDAWRAAAIKLSSVPGDWPTYDKFLSEAVEHVHGADEQAMDAFEKCLRASKRWYAVCEDSCRSAESSLTERELSAVKALGGFPAFQDITAENRGVLIGQFRKLWESNSFQTRRALNIPEKYHPRLAQLDRGLVSEIAEKLTLTENENERVPEV